MSAYAPNVHDRRALATVRSRVTAEAVAGTALVGAGVVILMGIITAEALYPDTYTTFDNEISDLGATVPPNSIIRQPSAHIFNTTMLVSGALILASAGALAGHPRKSVVIWLALAGLGVLGVGVFPGNRAPMHGIFALVAFVAGGGAAITSGLAFKGAFGAVAALLGATALASLVVAMLGNATPALDHLGDGGIERWVAYPTVLWFVLFGGYLLGRAGQAK